MRNWLRENVGAAAERTLPLRARVASAGGVTTALIQAAMRHRHPGMTRRFEMRAAKREVGRLVGRAFRDELLTRD